MSVTLVPGLGNVLVAEWKTGCFAVVVFLFFVFFSSLKPVYHPAYFLRNSLILMKHAYFIKINEVLIIPI